MRFTDLTIKSLSVGKHFDSSTPGFGIRVGKHRRTWIVQRGTDRRIIRVGHYPAISLVDARKKGKQLLAETLIAHERITMQEAYDLFVKISLPSRRPITAYEYQRILKRHYLPKLATRRLDAISSHMVLAITDELVDRPPTLIAVTAVGKTFFKWCIRRGYISISPLQAVQLPKPRRRKRVLTDQELRRVWTAAEQFGGPYGALVKLIILTGMRRTECAALQSDWVQSDRVTLPAEIVKNAKQFCFPTGPTTKAILESLKTNWHLLLPTVPQGELPFNTFAVTKGHFDKLLPGIARYTLHDLRRTYRTNLARIRVQRDVAERLLNHTASRSELEEIYDQFDHFDEMVEAVNKYDAFLTSLLGLDAVRIAA